MATRAPRRTVALFALSMTTTAISFAGVALADASARASYAPAPRVAAHDAAAPVPVTIAPSPKPKPVIAKPKPVVKATPKAQRPSPRPVTKATAPAPRKRASLTPEQKMMRAVDRIPGYQDGESSWVIKANLGSWGMAAMGGGVVYISPTVPDNRMYDVVAHEWSHILSAKVYGNDVSAAMDAMNEWFGGSDLTGAERAADCMALQLGATWTHYTSCTNTRWQAGAKRLLSRQRL